MLIYIVTKLVFTQPSIVDCRSNWSEWRSKCMKKNQMWNLKNKTL